MVTYNIGDIVKAAEIGKCGTNRYLYHECVWCGNIRWVMLRNNKPVSLTCKLCRTNEQNEKISKSMSGNNHPNWGKSSGMFGRHHSDKTKERIATALYGVNNYLFGKHLSKEIREKMSKSHLKDETRQRLIDSHTGSNNWNWQNGLSKVPYPPTFNEDLKEQIKNDDEYCCQLCGKYIPNGSDLCVHHIDYNKWNMKRSNLTSLCRSCNTKVNYNRNYWIKVFSDLLGGG